MSISQPAPASQTLNGLLSLYEETLAEVYRLKGEAGERHLTECHMPVCDALQRAPSALSFDEAMRGIDFVLKNMAEFEGREEVQGVLRASADFFRQFQQPVADVKPTMAHLLAYRQWLDMEASYLGTELFPEMGSEAYRFVPANTGVDRVHHPHGFRQGLVPPPSARAVKVLTAAGIDLAEIQQRHDARHAVREAAE